MTTFDDRERGQEAHFAHDQEQEFKAEARRDRMIALWAGGRMGMIGETLTDYIAAVIRADLTEPGDDDVFRKIMADLATADVECLPHELREQMDAFLVQARIDIREGR